MVNRNFGCGSSREHAPQALLRWGIRVVLGESFAEIFYGNCLALGIPCLQASSTDIDQIQQAAEASCDSQLSISLDPAAVELAGQRWELQLASDAQKMLTSGQWDATRQLLSKDQELIATAARLPYMQHFAAG